MLTPIGAVVKEIMKDFAAASLDFVDPKVIEKRADMLLDLSSVVAGWNIESVSLYTPQGEDVCYKAWRDKNTGKKILVACRRNEKGYFPVAFAPVPFDLPFKNIEDARKAVREAVWTTTDLPKAA